MTTIPFKTYRTNESGKLDVDEQEHLESTIFRVAPKSQADTALGLVDVGGLTGTTFGFVSRGVVRVTSVGTLPYTVRAGEWFSEPCALSVARVEDGTEAVLVVRHGFLGLRSRGGPVEAAGRLRYIDGCTDTLLCGPPVVGDPCLNLLHFPGGIHQTQHTHPSARIGTVVSGEGYCVDGDQNRTPLVPGVIFNIPAGCVHSFNTDEGKHLDVIAYHPDSDWGPAHGDTDTHPMLSRTWVDEKPIDNQTEDHDPIGMISGYVG